MQHHNAGRLPDAEALYRQILQAEPDHPVALQLLGILAYQAGKKDVAVDLIQKAIAIKPDYIDGHFNLGRVLQDLGKADEAVVSYNKVIALNPSHTEAHFHLGLTFKNLSRLEDAASSYRQAIRTKPDYVAAHYNLGNTLKDIGKMDEAVASYRKALAIKPDLAEAHHNLGVVLNGLGQADEAFACHRHAVALSPQNDMFWVSMAEALASLSFTSADDDLWQVLLQLLQRPTVRPTDVARPIFDALRHHPNFSPIFETTNTENPDTKCAFGSIAEQLSEIPLFLTIMGLCPVVDLNVERVLTSLRHALLLETIDGEVEEKQLPFSAALALQCFTNEYIFPETEDEQASVETLQQRIAGLVEKKQEVPPSYVAALAAYRALYRFPWAQALGAHDWADNIKGVIDRQITEPLVERSLRPQIPSPTDINNTVSQAVRAQYEEHPYPRWIKAGFLGNPRPIGAVLQGAPLHFDLGDYTSPREPEILVAGCGTGQQAISTASRFSNAHVLAVDLSLSSIAYALRKTNELGLANIEYAQRDILGLGDLGRQFDLIESVGVLHHLGEPMAGWRVLVDLLRSGGLMKIGLYSETARQNIVRGRSLVAEKGYTASAEDISRCRQDIIAQSDGGDLEMATFLNISDFFSLSECRDLLFHVQEHRFTLPQIEEALKTLNLQFLGFEVQNSNTLKTFKASYPNKFSLTSLSQWHQYEQENPDTFGAMYVFWCRKR